MYPCSWGSRKGSSYGCGFRTAPQELDVHRQFPPNFHDGPQSLDMGPKLAFVVGGAAPVEATSSYLGLERRTRPQLERIRRLDVVVAVEKHGRLAGSSEPFRVDKRMALRFDETNLEAHPAELTLDKRCGAMAFAPEGRI